MASSTLHSHGRRGHTRRHRLTALAKGVMALCLAAGMAACNSMDSDPSGTYGEGQFWTSVEKAQYMLNMVYNQHYSAPMMWSDETLGDNLIHARDYSDERFIRNGNADTNIGLFASTWKEMYGGIKTANTFLEHIGKLQAADSVKARMVAQARYLRAWMYLRLTTLYGDVPYFTTSLTADEAKRVSRTPHAQVMLALHDELDHVADDLPRRDDLADSERGQITRGAAVALQARAYLYDADWANAARYCHMLMTRQDVYGHYALYNDYQELFSQDAEYNEEIIADCEYAPRVRVWGDMYDMAPLSVGARVNGKAPTQSLVDSYVMTDGKAPDSSPLYDDARPYSQRDPRLTGTVVYDGYDWSANVPDGTKGKIIHTAPDAADKTDAFTGVNKNQTATGYYVRKYYDARHEARLGSAINIITLRYADVLLMYAEAMNEQQRMTRDVWDATIRPIRLRAGFTMASALDFPEGLSTDEMRQLIRRERRCELALEGLRWFDIKRWGVGPQCLDGYVRGARFLNNGTEHILLDRYVFNEQRDYLWSVPQSQMDINPNLKPNNPGYNN